MKTTKKKFKSNVINVVKLAILRGIVGRNQRNQKAQPKSSIKRIKESKNVETEKGLSALSAFELNNEGCIIADSGASIHLTGNIEWFSSFRKVVSPLILNIADGKTLKATHIGNIQIKKSVNGRNWERRT